MFDDFIFSEKFSEKGILDLDRGVFSQHLVEDVFEAECFAAVVDGTTQVN